MAKPDDEYARGLTHEEMRRLLQVPDQDLQQQRFASPTGRQAGKASIAQAGMSKTLPAKHFDPREMDLALKRRRDACVVVWTSQYRYTYAAIWANQKWFITGAGRFYGSNEFTHDEFVYRVLANPEVTSIYFSEQFGHVYER